MDIIKTLVFIVNSNVMMSDSKEKGGRGETRLELFLELWQAQQGDLCTLPPLSSYQKGYMVTYPPGPLPLGIDKGKGVKRKRSFASLRRSIFSVDGVFRRRGGSIYLVILPLGPPPLGKEGEVGKGKSEECLDSHVAALLRMTDRLKF